MRWVLAACLGLTAPLWADAPSPAALRVTGAYVPADLAAETGPRSSPLRELVERFQADRDDLLRFYSVDGSALQTRRLREFYSAWKERLRQMDFDSLGVEARIDWVLLDRELDHELALLDRDEERRREMAPLIPFAEEVASLQESRRLMQPVDGEASARVLEHVKDQIESLRKALKPDDGSGIAPLKVTPIVAYRAVHALADLKESLDDWDRTYDGYDPTFTWWTRKSYAELTKAWADYAKYLKEEVAGFKPGAPEPIVGDPIGRKGLEEDLRREMIPYSPEELIRIANQEFAWCDRELRRAARDMGYGDNWKAALAKVKQDHVPPGGQPELVRSLALEAIGYVTERRLVTVPPGAADFWRILMMPPEQQKVAPFFLGGQDILVAYPTDAMDFDSKEESLLSNNVHFARATVFHELIPGHHLQFYYLDRVNQHRRLFFTPFWIEGWALWWERYLWDQGFPRSPEDRMGMLFWRTHRCARILFSLNYHLGNWTAQQCVDFLVDRVGHERSSALGEVRRSFNGSYSPLYQVGYMIGSLQFSRLHQDLVATGKMTDLQFHDSILEGGPMPLEMERARLEGIKIPRDFVPAWHFYDLK